MCKDCAHCVKGISGNYICSSNGTGSGYQILDVESVRDDCPYNAKG
jgi:hypothetical protein